MEPENFQKENNNHTLTNILLFLVLLVMVTILFLMVKNQKKESPEITYVPTEEVPLSNPVANPPALTPNPVSTLAPTFNPNNRPLNTASISRGDLLTLGYTTENTTGTLYAFCENIANTNIRHFARYDDENCEDNEKVVSLDAKSIKVLLKPEYDLEDLNNLNALYGVETMTSGSMNGVNTEYRLKISSSNNYDSIALARIYFDTGYFTVSEPVFSPLIVGGYN